jgi:hypothetical protein
MVPESNDHEHVAADVIARHLGSPATRRTFVLGTLAFLAGCSTTGRTDQLPGIVWSDPAAAPRNAATAPRRSTAVRTNAIPRSSWAQGGCIPSNMNRMQPVQRITIHHDGMDAFTATSQSAASSRLERIRRGHLARGAWGDIGYHYAIDPAGRVWQCRELTWQGAHVKNQNPGNLGILVMGNYDRQNLTSRQQEAVLAFVSGQMRQYGVPASRLHTHQELAPTACPGRSLQSFMVSSRSNRRFG